MDCTIWAVIKKGRRESHYCLFDGVMNEPAAIEKARHVKSDGFAYHGSTFSPEEISRVGVVFFTRQPYPCLPIVHKQVDI